jgi:hypothetical protein
MRNSFEKVEPTAPPVLLSFPLARKFNRKEPKAAKPQPKREAKSFAAQYPAWRSRN